MSSGLKSRIFHSDQGNEFMVQRCTQYLEKQQIQVSVSAVASPWQNGFQESFFERFKQEFGDFSRFEFVGELFEAIHHHIHYYNHQRIRRSRCRQRFLLSGHFQNYVFKNWVLDRCCKRDTN